MTVDELKACVRTVPDFPRPGILFRDITTLIGNGPAFAATIAHLAERVAASGVTRVAGIEARGFMFGASVAARLNLGFVPLRKPGKLPVPAIAIDYALEYGSDRLEMDPGAVEPGERVVVIDDLIATGGTALAATRLLRQAGAIVDTAVFVIDLPELGGADLLRSQGLTVSALFDFPGH